MKNGGELGGGKVKIISQTRADRLSSCLIALDLGDDMMTFVKRKASDGRVVQSEGRSDDPVEV